MLSFLPLTRRRGVHPDVETVVEDIENHDVEELGASKKEPSNQLSESEGSKHQEEPKISVFGEFLVIVLALASISTSASSWSIVGKSATYVAPILTNWQTRPVGYIVFAYPNGSCPAGTDSGALDLKWPGSPSLGCGCPSSSGRRSTSNVCTDDDKSAGCADDTALEALNLDIWRGTKLCLNRTGQAVATFDGDTATIRPRPATSIPYQCADGYRRCGRTTLDKWRATCTPEEDVCPLTFAGSDKTLDFYGATSSTFEAHTFSRDLQPFYNQSHHNETLYVAESSLVVSLQLPLVEFLVSFMQDGSDYNGHDIFGPCHNHHADFKDNTQAAYDEEAEWPMSQNPHYLKNHYPDSCARVDSRWQAFDSQSESDLMYDNVLLHPSCLGLSFSDASLSNYWESGVKCSTNKSAPLYEQCEHSGYSHLASLETCADSDLVCQDAFFQTKCGKLMQMVASVSNKNALDSRNMKVGLFRRNEIYWKEECSSNYKSVQENNEPLGRALNAQLALLAINIFLNGVTIFIACLILCVYELNIDLPCIEGTAKEDAAFLKLMNKRISLGAKILKIGPIVTAIVFLSYVVDFYAEVASAQCSDATTNEAFTALGNTLPVTQWNNIATLCLDCLQIIVPTLFLCLKWHKERKLVSEAIKVNPLQRAASQKRHQEALSAKVSHLHDLVLHRDGESKKQSEDCESVGMEDFYESISIRTPSHGKGSSKERNAGDFEAPKMSSGTNGSVLQGTLASLSPELSSSPKRHRLIRRARVEEQI